LQSPARRRRGPDRRQASAARGALAHTHDPAHQHIRKTEHAAIPLPQMRLPDRDEDPLASMHFE
jgi:hypothetical protein